ncbi:hypothetical protein BYT27DRAFT_7263638 [Phlegmacium glaucopus]|nr:hypothetical protein BYT27DRAFT_7263638 [Phlegmacium glaucopus]
MEHQFRRGIYRRNAQRLSISIVPLVAQRSLMFRVKTDLATKASYAELTPMESPALFSLSENALIVSAVLTAVSISIATAMSSASVYSQDSWKSPITPFVPLVKVDPRRMAIAFSPSVQWSDMAEEDSGKEPTVKTPLVCSPFIPQQPDVSFSEVKEDNDTRIYSDSVPDVVLTLSNDDSDAVIESIRSFLDIGSPSPVEKRYTMIRSKTKKIDGQSSKRSKPSKAFRKVMAHLSFQPSKRELAQLQRATTISNTLLSMDFKLPTIRMSPIGYSFLTQTDIYPSIPPMPSSFPSSMAPSFDAPVGEDSKDAVGFRQIRATMPPPVRSPETKGHRRFHSSPAVPHFRRWDKDNMPPLPPMPAGILKPTLPGAVNVPHPVPFAI